MSAEKTTIPIKKKKLAYEITIHISSEDYHRPYDIARELLKRISEITVMASEVMAPAYKPKISLIYRVVEEEEK